MGDAHSHDLQFLQNFAFSASQNPSTLTHFLDVAVSSAVLIARQDHSFKQNGRRRAGKHFLPIFQPRSLLAPGDASRGYHAELTQTLHQVLRTELTIFTTA